MKRGEKKGFTVIEVSLVLAIAGLIFLMVFIALPALRRTQRDSVRRDDMLVFLRKVKDFQTNNRGALPVKGDDDVLKVVWGSSAIDNAPASSWTGFYRDYLEDFTDPDGEHYNMTVIKCGASKVDDNCISTELDGLGTKDFPNGYAMIVVTQATCAGETAKQVANPRKIAVLYRLEGAGAYCANT